MSVCELEYIHPKRPRSNSDGALKRKKNVRPQEQKFEDGRNTITERQPFEEIVWEAMQKLETERDILRDKVTTLEGENSAMRLQLEDMKNYRKVWQCAICFEHFLPENLYILDKCNHKYCSPCLGDYVNTLVDNGQTTVGCPSCNHPMEHHELLHVMKPEYQEKYEKFCLNNALLGMGDVVNCPSANCGNAFIRDPAVRDIHCMNCDSRFCADCKRLPHPDIPDCADVAQILKTREEVASEAWIAGYSKQCPRCRAPINKVGGCNHMTCSKCRHSFCWTCMREYAAGHFGAGQCQQYDPAPPAIERNRITYEEEMEDVD